jgi:hypothetical protein
MYSLLQYGLPANLGFRPNSIFIVLLCGLTLAISRAALWRRLHGVVRQMRNEIIDVYQTSHAVHGWLCREETVLSPGWIPSHLSKLIIIAVVPATPNGCLWFVGNFHKMDVSVLSLHSICLTLAISRAKRRLHGVVRLPTGSVCCLCSFHNDSCMYVQQSSVRSSRPESLWPQCFTRIFTCSLISNWVHVVPLFSCSLTSGASAARGPGQAAFRLRRRRLT